MTMKFASLARLRHLGGIRDAKRATFRALEDDRQHLLERLNAAKRDRANVARDYHSQDAAPRLDEIDQLIAHLQSEMTSLSERHEVAAAAHRAASGAYARARDFANEHGFPVPDGEGVRTWMGSTARAVPAEGST